MKKIGQVLIDSQETRKQILGDLVHRKTDDHLLTYVIDGYCALGALGCEAGLITNANPSANYAQIIFAYGLHNLMKKKIRLDTGYSRRTFDTISGLIVYLNDHKKLSFKQIGRKLLNWQKKGYFKRKYIVIKHGVVK